MEDQEPLFNETIQMICSNFEDDKPALINKKDFDSFHKALTLLLRTMLYNDYHRLINILYKMDIDEKKYTRLFKELPSNEIPEGLANLMIERAKQKAEMRRKYR
jgi:hypothetical protein